MKFIRLMALFLLFSVLFSTIAAAEERKNEWKNPNYDFKKLKTILIFLPMTANLKLDEFDSLNLETAYNNAFSKAQKRWAQKPLVFLTQKQFQEKIGTYTGLDMKQLAVDDADKFKELISQYIPISTDAVLSVEVKSFGYDRRFVPEYSYTYTEQIEKEVEAEFKDANGKWVKRKVTIREPVERVRTIPAHYTSHANAGLEYRLIDCKSKETVWLLLDIRESERKKPIDLTKNIIDRAADNLAKLF